MDIIIETRNGSVNATWLSKKTEAEFNEWVKKTYENKEFYARMLQSKRDEFAKSMYKQVQDTVKPVKKETTKGAE